MVWFTIPSFRHRVRCLVARIHLPLALPDIDLTTGPRLDPRSFAERDSVGFPVLFGPASHGHQRPAADQFQRSDFKSGIRSGPQRCLSVGPPATRFLNQPRGGHSPAGAVSLPGQSCTFRTDTSCPASIEVGQPCRNRVCAVHGSARAGLSWHWRAVAQSRPV